MDLCLTNLESEDCEGKHDASGDPSSNDDGVHIVEHADLRGENRDNNITLVAEAFLTIPRDTPSNMVKRESRMKLMGTFLNNLDF